jgi:hypothetical protein
MGPPSAVKRESILWSHKGEPAAAVRVCARRILRTVDTGNPRPLQLLHTNRIHLGKRFACQDCWTQKELVEAPFECLARLIYAANGDACEMLEFPGALFDRVAFLKRDICRAATAFADFEVAEMVIPSGATIT